MRRSHPLSDQLPGEHTGHLATISWFPSWHNEPIWNAHILPITIIHQVLILPSHGWKAELTCQQWGSNSPPFTQESDALRTELFIYNGPDLFSTARIEFKKLKEFCDLFLNLLCACIKMFTFLATHVHLTFQNGHCVLKAVKLAKRNRFIISSSMFVYPICINKLSVKVFVIYSGVQLNCEIQKLLNARGREKIRPNDSQS